MSLKMANTLIDKLKRLFDCAFCFVLLYSILLIFSLPILLILCCRQIVSVVFKIFYKNDYKLVAAEDGYFCYEKPANVFNINSFLYVEGPPVDIELLRERLLQKFTSGKRYERMMCSLEEKFGFFCWRNRKDTFDISYHVRYFPGCSDQDEIYSEDEVLSKAAEIQDKLWPVSLPRWEFLIIPQMRKKDTGEICSGIHYRQQHAYGDGTSITQFLRHCIADEDPIQPRFIIDPVNPSDKLREVTPWMKLFAYLQALVLGPWALLKNGGKQNKNGSVFKEGPLTGGKFYGRSKIELTLGMMRRLRKEFNCSTNGLQHFFFSEALRKITIKKGFECPEEVLGGIVHAKLPYPSEWPQNRAMIFAEVISMTVKTDLHKGSGRLIGQEEDSVKRLELVNQACAVTSPFENFYAVLAIRGFVKFLGRLPVKLINALFNGIGVTYGISNVPGIKDVVLFNGRKVINIFGFGPLMNGHRYFAGVGCYQDKFTFGFAFEKSNLINSEEDVEEFIEEFENQINMLIRSIDV